MISIGRLGLVATVAGSLLGCQAGTPLASSDPADVTSIPTSTNPPAATSTDPPAATSTAPSATSSLSPAQAQAELMKRWNLTVNAVGGPVDFHWNNLDQFPHPTYKGGTAQAYQAFAAVLVPFLQDDDNFAFLQTNQLFTMSLDYIFPSGANGLGTTFERLVADLSSDSMLSDDTQKVLKQISQKIELALGH